MKIGDMVHYVSYGTPGGEYTSQCRAAVITEITSEGGFDGITPMRATLCVLNPSGLFFNENAARSDDMRTGGTWHLMEACRG